MLGIIHWKKARSSFLNHCVSGDGPSALEWGGELIKSTDNWIFLSYCRLGTTSPPGILCFCRRVRVFKSFVFFFFNFS